MSLPLGKRLAIAAVFATAAGGFLWGPPAGAVQTTTWGIEAAPTASGQRAVLAHPADGKTVTDDVIVYNRTAAPLVVNLSVVGATIVNGTYAFATSPTGLAGGVTLAADRVALGPHQEAEIPVTIKEPRDSKTTGLAAIAAESAPIRDGSLMVQQRLVVLVKSTPYSAPAGAGPDLAVVGPLAAGALVLVGGLAVWELRRRRRDAAPSARLVTVGA